MTELAALLAERDALRELLRAVRNAAANPKIRRHELCSAIDIAMGGDTSPAAVAETLRRFDVNRTPGPTRPRSRPAPTT